MLPLINLFSIFTLPIKSAINTNLINIVFYLNVRGVNTTHQIFQRESDVVDYNSLLALKRR